MAMSNEDLLKELSSKSIMEVVELVKMLEEEWGVSAAAPVAAVAGAAAADGGAEAEKDESAKNIFIGVSMAFQQMKNTLGEYGLELIDPEGKEFDPKFHEALSYESSPDTEEGIVLKSVRIGYKMKDKLLRPASVIISKGTTEDK